MKIGFIGAGKAGFSLGRFFAEGGIHVTGYYSRHEESAREAAEFTGTRMYGALEEILRESDALFLTVPDGAISSVYQKLRAFDLSEKQICHCSGAMTAREAFPGIGTSGAFGYSIHPLFPISSKQKTYQELSGAFFCLEGTGPHLLEWKERLESLGASVHLLSGDRRACAGKPGASAAVRFFRRTGACGAGAADEEQSGASDPGRGVKSADRAG